MISVWTRVGRLGRTRLGFPEIFQLWFYYVFFNHFPICEISIKALCIKGSEIVTVRGWISFLGGILYWFDLCLEFHTFQLRHLNFWLFDLFRFATMSLKSCHKISNMHFIDKTITDLRVHQEAVVCLKRLQRGQWLFNGWGRHWWFPAERTLWFIANIWRWRACEQWSFWRSQGSVLSGQLVRTSLWPDPWDYFYFNGQIGVRWYQINQPVLNWRQLLLTCRISLAKSQLPSHMAVVKKKVRWVKLPPQRWSHTVHQSQRKGLMFLVVLSR